MEMSANQLNNDNDDIKEKEAPQLAALLKEMKEGLDVVRRKIQFLTAKGQPRFCRSEIVPEQLLQERLKNGTGWEDRSCHPPLHSASPGSYRDLTRLTTLVKENQYPTADGFSYLEAKSLLLLNYCQSLVYYLLRKAKGFSIEGHPVVRSIVEIRLYLEKIRPIDKKQQYQIQKLMKVGENATGGVVPSEKEPVASNKSEDVSKYRPNPDMLVSKSELTSQDGDDIYHPVKFAPTSIELDRTSKHERNALRREKEILKQNKQSDFIRTLMNDVEERPEEINDFVGNSREVDRYIAKTEERARQEEELFHRVSLTKMEKKREKYLKKSRNGLEGLTESFYDEIKTLPFEEKSEGLMMGNSNGSSRNWRLKKQKRRH